MLLDDLTSKCNELIRAGRFTTALEICDRALAGRLSPFDRCRILQIKARVLVAEDTRWDGPAVECLREALSLTAEESEERARVYCSYTAVNATTGNVVLCRNHRGKFVEIWQSNHPESKMLTRLYPHVEYNLALAFHEVERLDDAEEAYILALGAYQRLNDPAVAPLIADVKHNLVDVFQEGGRHWEAKGLMDEIYPNLPDATFGAQMRNRKAIWALSKGDHTAALLWVESGLGHSACDTRTRAALMLTKARLAQASGQVSAAHDCALEAMRLAALAESARLCHRIALFINSLSEEV